MPKWSVFVIIVVLVVGYYLLTQQARERRRDRVGVDFAKMPNFYANQTFTDVQGETAIGIDDRGRRIAVARKHAQTRTRVYSFAHLLAADLLQDDTAVAGIKRHEGSAPLKAATEAASAAPAGDPVAGLFGSTRTQGKPGLAGLPEVKPILGQLTSVAVRVKFQNGGAEDELLLRFYQGKPVNMESVVAERAFAEAKVLLSSLDIAMKRGGTPPRAPATPKTPVR
jgi:hypothetical protein